MVDTNFADLAWKATGSIADRSNAARNGDCINVKDWGAVGDGIHDDRPNIQAVIDYVQSTAMTDPDYTRYCGASIYLPPGNYRCNSNTTAPTPHGVLVVNRGYGAPLKNFCMFGDASATTRIFFDGPLLNPAIDGNLTILLCLDNDVYGSYFRGLHFDMMPASPGGPPPPNLVTHSDTLCVWNRGFLTNAGSNNLFVDLKVTGATYGFGISGEGAPQGAENVFLLCKVENCYKGYITFSSNALDEVFIGGYAKNCTSTGIVGGQGAWVAVVGVEFAGNPPGDDALDQSADYSNQNNQPSFVCGCVSTSQDFVFYANGCNHILANYHHSATPGKFFRLQSSPATFDMNWSTNGIFIGAETHPDKRIYLKGNRFDNPSALSAWSFALGLKQNI